MRGECERRLNGLSSRMNLQTKKKLAFALGILFLYASGLALRREVMRVQEELHGDDLPFTMESALHYRRVAQVFEGGGLPHRDPMLQYPAGVGVKELDTVGDEYVYAALARLFPRRMTLASRLRWIQPAWFCLGILLMACWLWLWRRSAWAAFIGAGYYAFSLAAVIRSTGQELSHENFAIPWLLAHLACEAYASDGRPGERRGWARLGSAVALAVALATWDMVQFYVTLWMIVRVFRSLRRPDASGGREEWVVHLAVLFALGLFNPYLRRHGFLWSPAMLLGYGLVLASVVRAAAHGVGCRPAWGRRFALVLLTLLPLAWGLIQPGLYGEAYGHFGALLLAKIRFLNRKPVDPALLTFDQRIMWVPALHSANWALTFTLFPAILILSLAAVLVLVRRAGDRSDSRVLQLFFFFATSFLAFVFFVRFHVFVIVFMAAALGLWASAAMQMRAWILRGLILVGLCYGMAVEAAHVLRHAGQWGRSGVYYGELDELATWLKAHVAPDAVLANFGLSGTVLAYGGCPILLHPKFESPDIRARVREYGEQLFKGTDKSFRDWADRHGAEYYVYAMGEFAPVSLDRQMRYFVDALNPPADCPARLFESSPDSSPYFRLLWGNRKYRVFKIRTHGDEALAARYSGEAQAALEEGLLDAAEYAAVEALRLNPQDRDAQRIMKHVGALKDQGFGQGYEAE